MAHTVVKFKKHETEEAAKGSHLVLALQGQDSEFTACGLAVPDYPHDTRTTEKGGVTCEHCQRVVKFYQSVKLY